MSTRTALIGTGKAAAMHAKALTQLPESRLVAVCSRSMEKAQAFAGLFNLKAYVDAGEMIQNEGIEVVVVCTPHPHHCSATVASIKAGAHVLVEKPLASKLEDCDAMLDHAVQYQKKLGVISQRRFFPACMRMKKAIDDGKIGKPLLGTVLMLGWRDEAYYASDPWRGSWKGEGGGVLVNQAPHQLDLLLWYMDDEPAELYGVWQNINHPYIEVEDTAAAIVRFKNGGVANILVSNAQKPGIYGKVHVHGSNGSSVGVQTDGGAMFIAGMTGMKEPPKNDLWTIPGEQHLLRDWEQQDADVFSVVDPVTHYIQLQQKDFIQAVRHDRKPLVDGNDGRRTVEIFTAIYRSMKEGRPIKWPLI